MPNNSILLEGKVIIRTRVRAVTGLHVGGSAAGFEIGGVDSPVIRDPISRRPYLPGSSVRGKMRSLAERAFGKEQNFAVGKIKGKEVRVHTCQAGDPPAKADQEAQWRTDYRNTFAECEVCSIFGVTGDEPVPHPTALIVRDAFLSKESVAKLEHAQTDLPFTEVKWEATIDRVTSAATPRQIERVPAGVDFEGMEFVYSIYRTTEGSASSPLNLKHFPNLLKAMAWLEEDYLGGLGARGGGKVRFEIDEVAVRVGRADELERMPLDGDRSVQALHKGIVDFVYRLFNFQPE